MAPPAPPLRWYVDYYQLNASVSHVGDAAIMVLVCVNRPRHIVLIDGGNGSEVAKLIVDTLGKIKAKYDMVTDPKLDAIVISHWHVVSVQGLQGSNHSCSQG